MKNYTFTQNWFGHNELEKILPIGIEIEFHILEIGCFEGRSTIWFLENLLKNPSSTITCVDPWLNYKHEGDSFNSYSTGTVMVRNFQYPIIKETFDSNIELTGKSNQVIINRGLSHEILPSFLVTKNKYDMIYVDGNHTSAFVLADAVLSWFLLKVGGLLIFDDYLWGDKANKTSTPFIAINSFIENFRDYLEIIHMRDRVIIKKIK